MDKPNTPSMPLVSPVPPTSPNRHSFSDHDGKEQAPLESVTGEDNDTEYPPLRTMAPVMIALYLAMFLVALDRIIISTAVPKITDEFDSIRDIGWYGSAYVLASCATQLLFGRIYLFYNTKLVFLVAVLLFEAGSAVCGAAPNSTVFILGRAIAGWGSSGVFSGVVVIMIPMVPLRKRPVYQGFLGAIFGISSTIGPLVGGAFTKSPSLTWRWCFWINLPIGGVSASIIFLFLHLPPPMKSTLTTLEKIKHMDLAGNLVFAPSITSLLLALQWGGSDYAWDSPRIIALLVLFSVLLIAWVAAQAWSQERATIPPHVILQRSIISGFCFSACIGGVTLSIGYYMPVWFQAIGNVDALQSGIRTLPFILALVFASIVAGVCISRFGYYTPCIILCSCLMSIGTGLLTTLRVSSGPPEWIGYQVLTGLGMGLGMQQSGLAAQVVLKEEDVPIGTSLMFFSQSLGGAIFVCVTQNVFIKQLIGNLGTVSGISGRVLANVGATNLRGAVTPEQLPHALVAYNKSITATFYVGLTIASVSIIPALTFEWKSVKGKRNPHKPRKVEPGVKAATK